MECNMSKKPDEKNIFGINRIFITFRGREEHNGQLDIELKINDYDVIVRSMTEQKAIELRDFLNHHYPLAKEL